jgi:hypothetical protein
MTFGRLLTTAVRRQVAKLASISHGVCGFAAIVLVIVSVWGWVLPMIGNSPTIRTSIETTERLGINPAAIFYTDVFEAKENRDLFLPIR